MSLLELERDSGCSGRHAIHDAGRSGHAYVFRQARGKEAAQAAGTARAPRLPDYFDNGEKKEIEKKKIKQKNGGREPFWRVT